MENKFLGSTGLAKILERLYDTFSKVGHTHDKSQITDFPTIPTNTSQLTNDSGYITADELDETIIVDSELLDGSENPVQNKVIKTEFDRVHDLIGDDNVPAQIENAIGSLTSEDVDIYVQNEEPIDASEGAIWIDMDEDTSLSPSVNIELDQTLTIEGMAADAKAVGDVVDSIMSHAGEVEANLSDYKTTVSEQFIEINTTINDHIADKNNPHDVTKNQIGLDQVDNTSDLNKPISYAVREALDEKANVEHGTHIPTCSASNDGQFLRVIDGVASWSIVPSAKEAVF